MHNNEKLAIKLLILGTGLIAYHFLQKMALLFTILSSILGAVANATAFGGANLAFSMFTDHGQKDKKDMTQQRKAFKGQGTNGMKNE